MDNSETMKGNTGNHETVCGKTSERVRARDAPTFSHSTPA